MGLPHKAGREVLVERAHVSSKEHPTDLASVVSGLITTSGHETNRRSSRRCRNKTVAHRDRINPRHDSASTTCVTIHRKHLGRDSPSECLVVVKPTFHRHKAGGEVLVRRRAWGAFPEKRLHSAKQLPKSSFPHAYDGQGKEPFAPE